MANRSESGAETATVQWRRADVATVEPPLVRRLPYLELKLEHPGLAATGHADQFFPDAVPYELDGEERVVYWRSALRDAGRPAEATTWRLACATTHGLAGRSSLPAAAPALTDADEDGTAAVGSAEGAATTIVVDGTVAGESTTARVSGYDAPDVRILDASAESVLLRVDGRDCEVRTGDRERIALDERPVEVLEPSEEDGSNGDDAASVSVAPELVVRCSGRRVLHHPAPSASYRCFPSFGLDIADVPAPLPVPTTAGELDDGALARALGVDLAARPYPERVLWQAFAYAAFDPHAESVPELAQLRTGHVVVRGGAIQAGAATGRE